MIQRSSLLGLKMPIIYDECALGNKLSEWETD